MKKFITALAATFATVVIGSAASAATPVTFGDVYGDIVYHEEVVPVADADPFAEEIVGGLGPQINFVASN